MQEKNTVGFNIKLIALIGLVTGATIYSLGFGSSTVVQNPAQVSDSNTLNSISIPSSAPAPSPVSVPTKTVVTPTLTPVVTKETAGSSVYKDGTYTAIGSYEAPGGTEQITITLVIKNDIVTGASGVAGSYDRTSLRYENAFLSGFKQYVVGKSIDSIQLGRVSGASLTPQGFNDALAQIKSQAKA